MPLRFGIAVALVFAETILCFSGGLQARNDQMASALRVVAADDADLKPLTMRAAYGEYLRPTLGARSASTLGQYETAIGHWEAFCAERAITTSNGAPETLPSIVPVDAVSQITDAMLSEFGRWLMADIPAGAGCALSSTETYAKKIRAILKKLGPRETGNPRGANVLAHVPAMDPVRDLAGDDLGESSIDLSDDEIGRIYAACEIATWPDQCPVLQWQTYIVILAMLGPRVNDAARFQLGQFPIGERSPVRQSPRTHPQGWLDYRQAKTKKRVIVPLPAIVAIHVTALRRANADRLFGWKHSRQRPFTHEWERITAQAGLSHVQRKHFRPTCNLRWTIAAGDREVGAMVLGHAAADVNSKHYMRNEAVLLTHVNSVQHPASFQTDPSRGPRQLFLF